MSTCSFCFHFCRLPSRILGTSLQKTMSSRHGTNHSEGQFKFIGFGLHRFKKTGGHLRDILHRIQGKSERNPFRNSGTLDMFAGIRRDSPPGRCFPCCKPSDGFRSRTCRFAERAGVCPGRSGPPPDPKRLRQRRGVVCFPSAAPRPAAT